MHFMRYREMLTTCALAMALLFTGVLPGLAQAPKGPTKSPSARKRFVQRVVAAPGVKVTTEVAFLDAKRTEKMDIYAPADLKEGQTLPCVVAIHGGGFTNSDKSDQREQDICNLLAQRGYIAVSINYALSDQSLVSAFPQNIHDCKEAVRFLRKNATTYHIDPQHIGVTGAAAGAYFSTLLALTKDGDALDPKGANADVSCQVQAAVDMYGTVDLTANLTSVTNAPTAFRVLRLTQGAWSKEQLQLYSPLAHVHAAAPPLLILHGKLDSTVPLAQAEALATQLKSVKATNTHFLVLPEMESSFGLLTRELDLRDTFIGFFDRYLKGKDVKVPDPKKPGTASPKAQPGTK